MTLSSPSISHTARELGVAKATLYMWVSKAKEGGLQTIQASNGAIQTVDVSALLVENKVLKQRRSRVEQEKAILKKAATYFAKELG